MTDLLTLIRSIAADLAQAAALTDKRANEYVRHAQSWLHAAMKLVEEQADKPQ